MIAQYNGLVMGKYTLWSTLVANNLVHARDADGRDADGLVDPIMCSEVIIIGQYVGLPTNTTTPVMAI